MIKKYKKKPVTIKAVKYNGENIDEIVDFVDNDSLIINNILSMIEINTLEGVMAVCKGDYIIKGINGEFYPCKPDIFEKTYEEYSGISEFADQFNVLCNLQRQFDDRILKENSKYPDDKMRLALFVELGEFFNEEEHVFKIWKKHPRNDRNKALEEYADCFALLLSLLIHYPSHRLDIDFEEIYYNDNDEQFKNDNFNLLINSIIGQLECYDDDVIYWDDIFKMFFEIGHRFNFTWDEIYTAFIDKNRINMKRQNEGY